MSQVMIRKEVMNELYDSTLIILGAVDVGMITREHFLMVWQLQLV